MMKDGKKTVYACEGSCCGVSDKPGVCQAKDCERHGKALTKVEMNSCCCCCGDCGDEKPMKKTVSKSTTAKKTASKKKVVQKKTIKRK